MNEKTNTKFFSSEHLLHDNEIEFKYHYSLSGYWKMFAGGTPIPTSIDIYRKSDHSFIKTLKRTEPLDEISDD